MPVIGGAFSGGVDRRRFVTLELFRGLAQRNKGRKTSYVDGVRRPRMRRENSGTGSASRPPPLRKRIAALLFTWTWIKMTGAKAVDLSG
jgi:hypothetical protein